jgi:hypothetical protein
MLSIYCTEFTDKSLNGTRFISKPTSRLFIAGMPTAERINNRDKQNI